MKELVNMKDKRMTVREVAAVLGCKPETVKSHIRKIFPDLMKNGITTYLTGAHVTVILENLKKTTAEHRGRESIDLQRSVAGIETSQSLDLQLALIERKAHELWKRKALEQEERAARAERQLLMAKELLIERESGLSAYQRIAEAGGFVMSDRDDVLATYGRRK